MCCGHFKNMLRSRVTDIIQDVQDGPSRFLNCEKRMLLLYEKQPESLTEELLRRLRIWFSQDINDEKRYLEWILLFLAKFFAGIVTKDEKSSENDSQLSIEEHTHPLLAKVIAETLKYCNVIDVSVRYHSCQFITYLLKNIENEVSNEICDSIQTAMLERIQDSKSVVRLQALTALVRLQEPANADCPVVAAFSRCTVDVNSGIRRTAIESIAISTQTLPRLLERIKDVEASVRTATFKRLSAINPQFFSIENRQLVLRCGFAETNANVKRVFNDLLLPKWLTTYEGEHLKFLHALKLDADVGDFKETLKIYRKFTGWIFKDHSIQECIEILPLKENKLVPTKKLSFEVVAYWNFLTQHLRKNEDFEEFLSQVLPDLCQFCDYVQRFIERKSAVKMNEFEYLSYEAILFQLFDILHHFDFSDPVARNSLKQITTNTLLTQKINPETTDKLVVILSEIYSNPETISNEICTIISDIHEVTVELPPSLENQKEHDYQIAELRVRLNMLSMEKEEAVLTENYVIAGSLAQKIKSIEAEIERLRTPEATQTVKKVQDDSATICRCLDIFMCLMRLPIVTKMNPALESFKENFLTPLLNGEDLEVFWRVLKVLLMYSLIDKSVMLEYLQRFFVPLTVYRITHQSEKHSLIVSIEAACDLVMVYGPEILKSDERSQCGDTTANTTTKRRNNGRKLFSLEENCDIDLSSQSSWGFEDVIDVLAELLDDESTDVRIKAANTLQKYVIHGLANSSSLMSRLLLKWFSRHTDVQLQQILGSTFAVYIKNVKGSMDIMEKAVVPTLVSIAKAPPTSPLNDIDIDNAMRFLSSITQVKQENSVGNSHSNLTQDIFSRIMLNPQGVEVRLLSKMLTYLDLETVTLASAKELDGQTGQLLEEVTDKLARSNITKFAVKLRRKTTENNNGTEITQTTVTTDFTRRETNSLSSMQSENPRKSTINVVLDEDKEKKKSLETSRSTKRPRRKSRKSAENKEADSTILRTIVEDEQEAPVEEMTIESFSSGSAKDSNEKTAISDTSSDTDSSSPLRRSKRRLTNSRRSCCSH